MKTNYNNLLKTENLHKALCEHFAYLADSPGFEPVLFAVMEKAHAVRVEEDKLIISFPGKWRRQPEFV